MNFALVLDASVTQNYVDEDDLEAELGGLEEEMAAVPAEGEAIPSYLQDHAPAVPTGLSAHLTRIFVDITAQKRHQLHRLRHR